MIFVIIGICILLIIVGVIIMKRIDDGVGFEVVTISVISFAIALISLIALGIRVSFLSSINPQIKMYQEENTKIEQQIADVVSQYQQYETEIFTTVAPEDTIALVTLYPELKSDKLVQKQINVYIANNKKIKALKKRQIEGNVLKWWLYFGGEENGK